MNEWMNEWMNKRKKERKNEWMYLIVFQVLNEWFEK